MEKNKLREPTQKRAIEKKQRIIEYGFKLMCENGYYNTDVVMIAKVANVSTGIIYQYFTDKRDIFLNGLEIYSKSLMFPLFNIKNTKLDKNNLDKEIRNLIKLFKKQHTLSSKAHEEITAMEHIDPDFSKLALKHEMESTTLLVEVLEENGFDIENIYEKSHLILSIIDNFCHELVYHKHENINYSIMEDEVINIIVNILK